jgi:hypothetical protein
MLKIKRQSELSVVAKRLSKNPMGHRFYCGCLPGNYCDFCPLIAPYPYDKQDFNANSFSSILGALIWYRQLGREYL